MWICWLLIVFGKYNPTTALKSFDTIYLMINKTHSSDLFCVTNWKLIIYDSCHLTHMFMMTASRSVVDVQMFERFPPLDGSDMPPGEGLR